MLIAFTTASNSVINETYRSCFFLYQPVLLQYCHRNYVVSGHVAVVVGTAVETLIMIPHLAYTVQPTLVNTEVIDG